MWEGCHPSKTTSQRSSVDIEWCPSREQQQIWSLVDDEEADIRRPQVPSGA